MNWLSVSRHSEEFVNNPLSNFKKVTWTDRPTGIFFIDTNINVQLEQSVKGDLDRYTDGTFFIDTY